jgi:hypothetical protein
MQEPQGVHNPARGPLKDILNEIERNLQDSMSVARNVMFHPRLSPGGGATEMTVSVRLAQKSKSVESLGTPGGENAEHQDRGGECVSATAGGRYLWRKEREAGRWKRIIWWWWWRGISCGGKKAEAR